MQKELKQKTFYKKQKKMKKNSINQHPFMKKHVLFKILFQKTGPLNLCKFL